MAPNREKGKGAGDGRKIIASNRRARHDYAILDTIEAGIVLTGNIEKLRDLQLRGDALECGDPLLMNGGILGVVDQVAGK